MNNRNSFRLAFAAASLSLLGAAPASAGARNPVVVELFTSQGCSSCPPANANLVMLSSEPDILALSFAVTYWDYLGWKDIFGREEFTRRQVTYEPALGQSGPFTPQMVINGRTSTVGQDLGEVRSLIAAEKPLAGPAVRLKGDTATIDGGGKPASPADIWLVRYDAGLVEVPVARGENAGETLPYAHVVRELTHLGLWDGKPQSRTIPPAKPNEKRALLVQERNGGQILAAATD